MITQLVSERARIHSLNYYTLEKYLKYDYHLSMANISLEKGYFVTIKLPCTTLTSKHTSLLFNLAFIDIFIAVQYKFLHS